MSISFPASDLTTHDAGTEAGKFVVVSDRNRPITFAATRLSLQQFYRNGIADGLR